MKIIGEKQPASAYPPYPNGDGDDTGPPPYVGDYDDDLPVQCPPHTTERKLVARIDAHVMPFLCIMYRE